MAIADIDSGARQQWADALKSGYADAVSQGLSGQDAKSAAYNSAEHALKGAGYDGYEASKNAPGHVFAFGDVPIDAQSTPSSQSS